MKLVKKLFQNKKKAEKKAKKTKRVLHALGLCAAFCAGAACTGYLVYVHRNVLAAAVVGKNPPKSPHRCCCRLFKKH